MRGLPLALALLALPILTRAEIFDDGGSHVFDTTTNEQILVDNGTKLEVLPSAVVSPSEDLNGLQAVNGSTIILRGGHIEGGTGPGARIALAAWDCDVEISGPVVLLGGISTGTTGGKAAFVSAYSPYQCSIDGGQFLGRDNPTHGGPGATVRGEISIRSGEFRGGDGESSSGGIGLWLTGGQASIETVEAVGGAGGINGGSALIASDTEVTILGGTFKGGAGPQSGGTAFKAQNASRAIIRGGTFMPGAHDGPNKNSLVVIDDAIVELRGGSFEFRFSLMGNAQLVVYGKNLVQHGSGGITGVLEDGTPIDMPIAISGEAIVTLVESVAMETTSFGELKARY
jgi:hypothetical protein